VIREDGVVAILVISLLHFKVKDKERKYGITWIIRIEP
jgi:hypothetical protein